ncbi:terpene synthase family protein [Streptomyces morookaense]|uniref:Terpene synthase n=1 Tax=Streptomyces morookaense TaxID=1970 RepID=A0A7Y7B793_STRMO|nr:hypothetical protein [Streptomyces morookaense]NVK80269.1 hypothetical protein [Streptomyces morookaense]GHF40105.1 hypothetical protein GCM10010359_48340 [Streptomyces morookaense]
MQPIFSYRVPDLVAGIAPPRPHRLAQSISDFVSAWVKEAVADVVPAERAERFAQEGNEWLTIWTWPDAREDRVHAMAALNAFAFFADDVASGQHADVLSPDGVRHWAGQYIASVAGERERVSDRWALSHADLWDRVMSCTPLQAAQRMRQDWIRWIVTFTAKRPAAFDEDDRYENAGGPVTLPITAFCAGLDATEPLADPQMRSAAYDAVLQSILTNDIITYGAEFLNKDDADNPIPLFMAEHEEPLQHAADRLCARILDLRESFLRRRENIMKSPTALVPGAVDYLGALEALIAGVIRHHATAGRYRIRPDSTWLGAGPALIEVFSDGIRCTPV